MKVAYLIEPQKIELRDVQIADPKADEILIQIKSALTCGTDIKAYKRGHPMIPMPGPFGHEFSGIAVKVGSSIKSFKEGDPIMAVHSAPCGRCKYCKKGMFNQCESIMENKVLGAFAEYLILPEHIVRQNTFLKPPSIDFKSSAMLEPLACVVHGLSGLNITNSSNVAIIGNGPIAILHILSLKLKGAHVLLIGRNLEKLNNLRRFGADEVFSIEEIRNNKNFEGTDFVFECTGDVGVWELTPSIACKGGVVVLFGGCKAGTKVTFDTYRLHYDEITIKGSFHFTPHDVKEAYNLLCSGLNVSDLITHTANLVDISDVFERLSSGQGLKYCIEP
ncbi:MAG TPA: alcohol dehydrogenase catalytic domain-containing protein [Nitrospirae bacterium]|nr:alcohol dehydrogenase catalytic domain-containing protein [Nitrospirota bacterium]